MKDLIGYTLYYTGFFKIMICSMCVWLWSFMFVDITGFRFHQYIVISVLSVTFYFCAVQELEVTLCVWENSLFMPHHFLR